MSGMPGVAGGCCTTSQEAEPHVPQQSQHQTAKKSQVSGWCPDWLVLPRFGSLSAEAAHLQHRSVRSGKREAATSMALPKNCTSGASHDMKPLILMAWLPEPCCIRWEKGLGPSDVKPSCSPTTVQTTAPTSTRGSHQMQPSDAGTRSLNGPSEGCILSRPRGAIQSSDDHIG